MEADFWHARWAAGEIGFHLAEVHPKCRRYWPSLGVSAADEVLVPLCGKSRDMVWLHEQGHCITGVELSRQALEAFVHENGLTLSSVEQGYQGNGWRLVCGDWFHFQAGETRFSAFYDRAALIALPAAMRQRYVAHLLAQLAPGARGLLITLEYPQAQMDGPPFSVSAQQVHALFAGHTVKELARSDILSHEPRFRERGLTALEEVVWSIRI